MRGPKEPADASRDVGAPHNCALTRQTTRVQAETKKRIKHEKEIWTQPNSKNGWMQKRVSRARGDSRLRTPPFRITSRRSSSSQFLFFSALSRDIGFISCRTITHKKSCWRMKSAQTLRLLGLSPKNVKQRARNSTCSGKTRCDRKSVRVSSKPQSLTFVPTCDYKVAPREISLWRERA